MLKKNIVRSLGMALAASAGAYLLSWGLFTTHPEVEAASGTAFAISSWTFVVVLIGCLLFYGAKNVSRK